MNERKKTERKRSEEYLVINLTVERKLSDFLASRSSPSNSKHRAGKPAHKLKLYAKRLRIFRDTSIVVSVNVSPNNISFIDR